jgi:hypothetical protein
MHSGAILGLHRKKGGVRRTLDDGNFMSRILVDGEGVTELKKQALGLNYST